MNQVKHLKHPVWGSSLDMGLVLLNIIEMCLWWRGQDWGHTDRYSLEGLMNIVVPTVLLIDAPVFLICLYHPFLLPQNSQTHCCIVLNVLSLAPSLTL